MLNTNISKQSTPMAKIDADVARGERKARFVLEQEGFSHLADVNIEDFAYLRGALVRKFPLKGCEGRISRRGNRAIISVSTSIDYAPKRRFVIAHELGHLELHDQANQAELAFCDDTVINELYDQGTEKEANAFATELLMPSEVWAKLVDVKTPSLDVAFSLAQQFKVSYTAAAIRFAMLAPERCCVVFAQNGKIKWAASGSDFGHWIERGSSLHPATLASDYFLKGHVPPRQAEEVAAKAWLSSPRARTGELWEHCRVLSSIHATLSLLWIPDGAEF
ncbi:ImmA/IrrE family metallo-endopeptidase [Cystobacter fuscus]|uniref:ImmA/IrrE family metallo-endopeptidase n=1 Tax=Cystobacter fuscus TaxID=43 RepID=UPI00138AC6E9|nr:ImmA/IrrE family metallo-endopeptidase [Cystobacter fuscus]